MIRVAIVGVGAISKSHIEAYLRFPDRCRIDALVDTDSAKARDAVQRYGLADAAIYADYQDLLAAKDDAGERVVDLVSVCLPPLAHASVSCAFLSRGIHVLVEKPMAPALSECDQMIRAAEHGGAVLSVVAQNRFTNPMARLKAVLDSGLLGDIRFRRIDSLWWRGPSYYDLSWRGTWESEGGGPTLNHAVHHIDLFLWMSGAPAEVTAVMSNVAHSNSEVEDLSVAILRYHDGTLAQITSSVVHHGEEQRLEFQGEHAMVALPWSVFASTELANGFPRRNDSLQAALQQCFGAVPELPIEGHAAQIADVLRAIEEGGTPSVDGKAGRATMELITAIYKAAISRTAVMLPISKDDPLYHKEGIGAVAPRFHKKTRSVAGFETSQITLGSSFEQ